MPEVSQPAAKSERVPPPTGLAAVWKHLKNWQEVYLFLPLSFLAIYLFAQFGYFLTGRRPQESADWIVGIAANCVKCVLLIVLVSLMRQQTGVWLNKSELTADPEAARNQMIGQCVQIIVFAYVLTH